MARPATSDGGQWLTEDRVPASLEALIAVFFGEMWPMLTSTMEKTTAFIESDAHEPSGGLPGKTFTADPPWYAHQTGDGALTHDFEIGGIQSRRMVVPYHFWMLQRLAAIIEEATANEAGRASVTAWLEQFSNGGQLLELSDRLAGCRVRKDGALLYSLR